MSIPMGYTNSMQIQHGDLTFLLQDKIPDTAVPFVDDILVKGPPTCYKTRLNSFETIPKNPGIHCFVWEHLQNVNHILQYIQYADGTFSVAKSYICTFSAVVVGYLCTYNGCLPDTAQVQKIIDWLVCKSLTKVQGFLEIVGIIHIFIKNYATIACPLVHLTRKNIEFTFGKEELVAMEKLKGLVKDSSVI